MSNINILIIEDEAIIAEDISDMIRKIGYEVAAIIGNGDKALDYLGFHYPDLVLCDIMIKGTRDGIQIAEWLRKNRQIPFLFLTSLTDRATLDRAKTTLPYGYIVKPFDEKDLLTSIEMALYKFSQEMDSMKLTREKLDSLASEPLTDREYEILNEMINGLNNEQISKKVFLSNNTIKYHTKNILSKFEAANRGEVMQKIITKWMTK
ncbi:MAG: response regulator transcription factor [Saprospiraceae bacterium]|nr:response regulator transcription factor [Saprospiraceae bacterium]